MLAPKPYVRRLIARQRRRLDARIPFDDAISRHASGSGRNKPIYQPDKPMTSGILAGIERWPLDQLIPYARNARTHSEEQVAQIAAFIIEFGWLNPVLIDDAGNVIAGHGRLLAARKLG
jgi:hypothetical protein